MKNFLKNIKKIECKHCGKEFDRMNMNQLFCSDKCRFFAKVIKTESCWIWTSTKNRKGYGTIKWGPKDKKAHRVSYLIHKGDIPDGKIIMHSCDNPSCVNPDHLKIGTDQENISDCVSKDRNCKGENHPRWNPDSPQHKHNPSSPFYVGPK
jgi:hypothetical protein